MTDETAKDFTVTMRPTRTGFRLPDEIHEGRFLRLWIGTSSEGQEFGMLSFGTFCHEKFHGFDYTPVDVAALDVVPDDIFERMTAVNKLVDAFKAES